MAVDSTPTRPPEAGFFPLARTAAGCPSRRSTGKSATGYDWRRCGSGWGVTTSPPGSVQCRSNKVELSASSRGRVIDAADRAEQVQRNVVVAFALAAYHRDAGRYPVTLDVLAPRFLAAIPGDVFSGRALVYRRDGAGYLLYSVGANEKDDGGRQYDDDPVGDDLRVRMPPK